MKFRANLIRLFHTTRPGMQHDVELAIDNLHHAHAASMKAHAYFMKCQATVLFKLDPDTPFEDYVKLVDADFQNFIQKPKIDMASDEDFEDAHVTKTFRAPSWTLNESLDADNLTTFGATTKKKKKRRACVYM